MCLSFGNLSSKFDLPGSSLFRYFQVRHFLQSHDPNFPYLLASDLDSMLEIPFKSKGLIARIHNFMSSIRKTTIAKIRADWMAELGEDMDDDEWNCAVQRVNNSTSCARLSIIQFKVLHRAHLFIKQR